MLSTSDDTNAETHRMTIIAIASWFCKEVKKNVSESIVHVLI